MELLIISMGIAVILYTSKELLVLGLTLTLVLAVVLGYGLIMMLLLVLMGTASAVTCVVYQRNPFDVDAALPREIRYVHTRTKGWRQRG